MSIRILHTRNRVTGKHSTPVMEWAIVCAVCQVDVGGYDDRDEAVYLTGIHNDLHHGSRTDAIVAPVTEPDPHRSPREPRHGVGGLK